MTFLRVEYNDESKISLNFGTFKSAYKFAFHLIRFEDAGSINRIWLSNGHDILELKKREYSQGSCISMRSYLTLKTSMWIKGSI